MRYILIMMFLVTLMPSEAYAGSSVSIGVSVSTRSVDRFIEQTGESIVDENGKSNENITKWFFATRLTCRLIKMNKPYQTNIHAKPQVEYVEDDCSKKENCVCHEIGEWDTVNYMR